MVLLLSIVIIILILFICFIVFCSPDTEREYKKLRTEYNKLKIEYDKQVFELKKYKNEDNMKNKEMAREFLTDTAYWMKRAFYYAKENQKLRKKK